MKFDEWEPAYERILADFGFDRSADERARDVAAGLVERFDLSRLASVEGATAAVVGAAPSLSTEVERAADADCVVAASTAADELRAAGIDVDLMVTDLDKNPETALALTREGTPVAAHAHGDNVDLVETWLPRFETEQVVATTQAAPVGHVYNFGGFTDGDRAAFLVDAVGAGRIRFVGWDFDDPTPEPAKRRKLRWAERLLGWLERRRDERFDVLDGRRPVDLSFLEE